VPVAGGEHDDDHHGRPRRRVTRAPRLNLAPFPRAPHSGAPGPSVIATAQSATETASMPLAGVVLAVAGTRAGAVAMAVVAVVAVAGGVACVPGRRKPAG
jgi:hypothetical protein